MVTGDAKQCPECGEDWDGGDILQEFLNLKADGHPRYAPMSDEQLEDMVEKCWGWTRENPRRWSRLIGVEIPGKYDGISYWKCPGCGATWDRWTGKRVWGIE